MPANPRVRTNNVQGTISDNPLLVGATTLNSAGLANLAAISSQHAVLILDPLRSAGAPEIVVVTAHTGAATSATITRGAYGTTARQHAAGVLWVHAAITEDFIAIVTSGARPSDPYRGQLIFETDTDKLVGRSIADAWQEIVDLGAWDTWTPTLTAITQGNGTVSARWTRNGRTIRYRFRFTFGSTSAVAVGARFTLPVAPATSYAASTSQGDTIGNVRCLDSGTADYGGHAFLYDASGIVLPVVGNVAGTYLSFAGLTNLIPMTWATGDVLMVDGQYEAAA